MENKLQQLTEKLYQDGLSKGKSEAEQLVKQANHQAEKILEDAEKRAAEIVAKAEKKALETKRNAESEIDLASRQTIARVKQTVENLIVAKAIEAPIANAFDDLSFVKELIQTVVKNSMKDEDLTILLPETKENEFLNMVQKNMQTVFEKGVDVKFERNIKSGFRIEINRRNYQLSFTDSDFTELFKTHIRSKLLELLFGKQ